MNIFVPLRSGDHGEHRQEARSAFDPSAEAAALLLLGAVVLSLLIAVLVVLTLAA
jgi:predicted nucleic acid-binding protein